MFKCPMLVRVVSLSLFSFLQLYVEAPSFPVPRSVTSMSDETKSTWCSTGTTPSVIEIHVGLNTPDRTNSSHVKK